MSCLLRRLAPALVVFLAAHAPAAAAECERLTGLTLRHTTITLAQRVEPGAFRPPSRAGGPAPAAAAAPYAALPAFCRVTATLAPTSDSDIKIEVWLPDADRWNSKFQAVGNGGLAGVISYAAMADALAGGYATASTDTGHTGNSGAFALGHPEKVVDFGHRAVHEMTVAAKAIIEARFGRAARASLWNGCSQGGRQGITAAMRYPGDFDAISAGAPSIGQALLYGTRLALFPMVHRSAGSYIPPAKYPAIHKAALRACDAADGLEDGVIEDPARCRFDPKVLECKGGDSAECLTAEQVETARALYAPLKHPRTRAEIAPPLLVPGTELSWNILAGPQPFNISVEAYKYMVFNDPDWDYRRFDPATDIDRALEADKGVVGLADPDLRPFFSRGGKLLIYHGWADAQVPPTNTIRYFEAVVGAVGRDAVGKSIQLYMVPGMGHCRGGAGTDTFDKMGVLEQWMASGRAPASIPSSRSADGKVVRTRPLCPYGQVAKWNGTGSSDDGGRFSCVLQR